MTWWERWRADLARPEEPTSREELVFLTASAAVIIAIAQWDDPGSVAELIGLVPAFAAFVLRGLGRLPAEAFAALVIVPVVLVVGRDGNLEGTFFLVVMVTLYTSWHLRSITRAVLIAAAAIASPWIVAEVLSPDSAISWSPWASASVFTYVLGRVLRRQRRLIDELAEAREALAERAVAEERRRIARELHDLAGHTLAAVLLHVTGARHVLRRDTDEAERALLEAESVGRASLDQIRVVVGALRADERGTDPSLAGSAELGRLLEEYRRAGLTISASIDDDLREVEGPVGTALHRITRESLANVAQHATSNAVEVTVLVSTGTVEVVVADHGVPGRSPESWVAAHYGLMGMHERARALGGRLEAGPTPDGWRVAAWLPLADARPAPAAR